MTEQKAKSTTKNQVTKEARQRHRQRLVLTVLTVIPELPVGHLVTSGGE